MVRRKGVSLIVLIITIVIVIILAATVILNLNETNIIDDANKAVILNDIDTFETELELYKMNKVIEKAGNYNFNLLQTNASGNIEINGVETGETIFDIIPSLENKDKYNGMVIQDGKLKYTGEDVNIQNALEEVVENLEVTKNESSVPSTPVSTVLDVGEVATVNSCYGEVDSSNAAYNNPVIPVGFKAVNTDDASWASMQWNNGLVIEDEDGNQFVWVPIDGINVTYSKDFTYEAYYSPNASNTFDDTLPVGVINEETQITSYGGFYIGRYESSNLKLQFRCHYK